MDISKLISSLSALERKIVPFLSSSYTLSEIVEKSGLTQVEVMRALQFLSNKDVVEINPVARTVIELGENGLAYKEKGLPERIVISLLSKGPLSMGEIEEKSGLSKAEVGVAIGFLKKGSYVDVTGKQLALSKKGMELSGKLPLERLLESIKGPVDKEEIIDKESLGCLQKRKDIIKTRQAKDWKISLTAIGKRLAEEDLGQDLIERISHSMIKDGSWKDKEFRRYDVNINVPRRHGGKRHFVSQAVEYAKKIWLEMGFQEMTGNLADTSFWVFDALFTPQDHPVREMQDTFFIGEPEYGNLPSRDIVRDVKKAHEEGVAGSSGWKYEWDEDEARRNVMRTHTTVLSARTLASLRGLRDKPVGKYFVVGRNFRNETVDWSHLFEFNQTDGIVVDPDANFCHLLGYLKEFFRKMGYPDARFRPAFFSYTEPSIEIDVYHPVHEEWVELGGAGMLRPEVVVPLLGKDIPVLAWGPGFDRIYLEYYNITDIRELYRNDLKQLREAKIWLK